MSHSCAWIPIHTHNWKEEGRGWGKPVTIWRDIRNQMNNTTQRDTKIWSRQHFYRFCVERTALETFPSPFSSNWWSTVRNTCSASGDWAQLINFTAFFFCRLLNEGISANESNIDRNIFIISLYGSREDKRKIDTHTERKKKKEKKEKKEINGKTYQIEWSSLDSHTLHLTLRLHSYRTCSKSPRFPSTEVDYIPQTHTTHTTHSLHTLYTRYIHSTHYTRSKHIHQDSYS